MCENILVEKDCSNDSFNISKYELEKNKKM